MNNIKIITMMTLKEAIRKKIVLTGIILGIIFLIFFSMGAHFAMQDIIINSRVDIDSGIGGMTFDPISFQASIFLYMGLFVINLAGALIAVFSACGIISTELRIGTLQAIVVRPITRKQIIFGKWLGNAIMLSTFIIVLYAAVIGIIYSQSGWLANNIILAGMIFIVEILVILSFSMFGSSFLSTNANAVITIMLFIIALIGGLMEQVSIYLYQKALYYIGIITGFIMPTDILYRYAVNLLSPRQTNSNLFTRMAMTANPFGASTSPSIWMLVYVIIFIIALIAGSMIIFEKRDL